MTTTILSKTFASSGLGDFLAVLDAERQLYGNEDLLAQSQTAVTTNLIALYKPSEEGWNHFSNNKDFGAPADFPEHKANKTYRQFYRHISTG